MKKLSKLYFLLSLTVSLIGSQQESEEFSISTSVERLNTSSLVYCDQAYINFCNQNGIQCVANEPFLPVFYARYQLQQDGLLSTFERLKVVRDHCREIDESKIKRSPNTSSLTNEFQKITHLPYALFHNGDEFKKEGEGLFKMERIIEGVSYKLKATLDSNFGEKKPKDLLNELSFKTNPRYMLGGQFFNGSLIGFVDTEFVKQELIKAGILAWLDGKLIHGPHGYFGTDAYNQELWKHRKTLLFSYVKKPALGLSFLFLSYLLWITYNKYC